MKIILSRKGFDSENGCYPSPILPDKRIVSLPIPSSEDNAKYSNLLLNKNKTYLDLMKDLKIEGFDKNTHCHLDPDIYRKIKQRNNKWIGTFGQINIANSHLNNQNVKVGDLFLFFGWFKFTEMEKGKLRYTGTDMHIIFGYLQIGQIYNSKNIEEIPEYLKDHPHYKMKSRRLSPSNSIYCANNHLTLNPQYPGYGVFKYNEILKLTKDGYTRSCWDLPDFFKNLNISYHSKASWKKDYFQSVGKGQEFVIEENDQAINWAYKIIRKCLV